jgi:ribosomal protein S27AE
MEIIKEMHECPVCGGLVYLAGYQPDGKQRYACRVCRGPKGYPKIIINPRVRQVVVNSEDETVLTLAELRDRLRKGGGVISLLLTYIHDPEVTELAKGKL